MSGLAFISYLGPNTVPIARQLGDRLTDELAIDFAWEPATWADLQTAIDSGAACLFWMCGLLTVESIDGGQLDAEIVAAPVFPGETAPVYRSVVIARRGSEAQSIDDLRGAHLAINGTGSWSGYHSLRAHLAELGSFDRLFGSVTETGSHDASIDQVLAGAADCAAIDSSVWDDRNGRDPRLKEIRVVGRTRDWPAPPFAVSRAIDAEMRRAIAASLTRSAPVGLEAIVPADDADYDLIRRGMALARDVAW